MLKPDIAGEYAPHGALLTAGWWYWNWPGLSWPCPLTSRSRQGLRPCPFFMALWRQSRAPRGASRGKLQRARHWARRPALLSI